ncbi:MAG: SAM-dependent methyltransferase [Massilia sp.]
MAAPPAFNSRNPLEPGFWDERFERGFTPWDRGGVPQALRDFAAASRPMVTLIPGCGAAYELAYLCEQGWDATAIDFAPAAVDKARAGLSQYADRVVLADFFAWQAARPLQLIYERAFLCAFPRAMWQQVADRYAALLPAGALLAGFFFFDENEKGPPFGITTERLDQLLSPYFERMADAAVSDSIRVFEGKERWQVWRRRADKA